MKRSERHHLKENVVAVAVVNLQRQLSGQGRGLAIGIAAGLVVLILFGGYVWWSERAAGQAGTLLADALLLADAQVVPPPSPPVATEVPDIPADDTVEAPAPVEPVAFVQPTGTYPTIEAKMAAALPKLIAAADAYPGTHAGITARYRAATALAALGRHDESADQYQLVIDRDSTGVYGRMSVLGLADVQIARGAYDEAITLLEQSTGIGAEAELPVDGVLMRLGHAYDLAGRLEDARATFQRVMDEFPASFYFANAERELQALQTAG